MPRSNTQKAALFVIILTVVAALGLAQTHGDKSFPVITAKEAAQHVGKVRTVCGVVAGTYYASASRGQPTFLNIDKPYPRQPFTVVIWGENRHKFASAPEKAFDGKRVCVTGVVGTYRGKPQIILSGPEQIEVKGDD